MSTVAVTSRPELPRRGYTPEDLLTMPDGHLFELVNGQLLERNMGAESSLVAARTIRQIGPHVDSHRLGKVFGSDCGYQIFPDAPRNVRFPDGSFVAKGRLEDGRVPKGHMRIAPDLAIEVVSPHDSAEEVDVKRVDYLNAGVKLLWIIYPETRSVHIFRLSGAPSVLTPHDELDGEEVVPGFRCLVSTLFEDLTE